MLAFHGTGDAFTRRARRACSGVRPEVGTPARPGDVAASNGNVLCARQFGVPPPFGFGPTVGRGYTSGRNLLTTGWPECSFLARAPRRLVPPGANP